MAVTTVSGRFTLRSYSSPIQGIAGTAEESSTQGFGMDIEHSYPALAPMKIKSVTLDSGPGGPVNVVIYWWDTGPHDIYAKIDGITTLDVGGEGSFSYSISPQSQANFRIVSFVANGNAVPEPATWAKMLVGLGAMVG
jgi:hypothetical protein